MTEELSEQGLAGGDDRGRLAGQLVEKLGDGSHLLALCQAQPRRTGQARQIPGQRHRTQDLEEGRGRGQEGKDGVDRGREGQEKEA